MLMEKIKVLIIDDSQLVRQLLTQLLSTDKRLIVVGAANDPYEAREMIKQLNPDVLTLDVEMPRMNGITFLKNLMRLRPMPVVMISTLTEQGAEITLEALEIGAVDYIAKPKLNLESCLLAITDEICSKVKQAAQANIAALEASHQLPTRRQHINKTLPDCQLIAIGASTGGTEAIKQVLSRLPENMPPIVVVQHMPAGFTASYANRLNNSVPLTVVELNQPRVPLKNNHVYIAHGASHLEVKCSGKKIYGVLSDGEPVSRHKPSVDVLFTSVAKQLGAQAAGVLLTGMGRDGAEGLKLMRDKHAYTIAQDEETSVVWGMPRAAVELHAAETVCSLFNVAEEILNHCYSTQEA